jgi:DME family drug/metabolite transporter
MSRTSPSHGRSVALVVAGGVMLGSAGTAAAFGPDGATPAGVGGLRLLAGAVALTLLLPLVGGRWSRLPGLVRRPTVWVMGACSAAFQPLFFGAAGRAGVAVTTLLAVGSIPVFAGLVGWLVLRHRPSAAWVAATAVAVTGLALRSWGELELGSPVGLLMALAAGFCVACYLTASKIEVERGTHPVELPVAAYGVGSVVLAPVTLGQPLAWALTPAGFAVVVYLGVVTMALGNVLPIVGMRSMGPGPASIPMLADPLTATALGVLVLGETIPPLGAVGVGLVVAGLALQARGITRTPLASATVVVPVGSTLGEAAP